MGEAFLEGFGALGFGDPIGVFAAAAWGEGGESFGGGFVFFECGGERGRNANGAWLGGARAHGAVDGLGALAGGDEFAGEAHIGEQVFVAGQVFHGSDAAEGAHGVAGGVAVFGESFLHFRAPKTEGAVLLEGGHVGENHALLNEEGHAPLDGFCGLGTSLMHEIAEMMEDRLGEGRGLFDVGVNARVSMYFGHRGSSGGRERVYTKSKMGNRN